MSAQTTPAPATTTGGAVTGSRNDRPLTKLAQIRQDAIDAYTAALRDLEAARAKNADTATLVKIAGRMGSPATAVENAELAMSLASESYEPWTKPKTGRQSKTLPIGTADEVQAKVDALRACIRDNPHTKTAAQRQIDGYLKAAAKRGLEVS